MSSLLPYLCIWKSVIEEDKPVSVFKGNTLKDTNKFIPMILRKPTPTPMFWG